MTEYGALMARLRQGVSREQWDAILADIWSEDTAYVGLGNPGYYVGPHSVFIFEGKVYDATRGFVVRDDGAGTMRLVDHGDHMDQGDHVANEETEGTR